MCVTVPEHEGGAKPSLRRFLRMTALPLLLRFAAGTAGMAFITASSAGVASRLVWSGYIALLAGIESEGGQCAMLLFVDLLHPLTRSNLDYFPIRI